MPETKWTADPDGSVWEGENCIADINTGDGGRDAELAELFAAAPETKRQRDALIEALSAMVDRWEPDTEGTDRVMWENACAIIAECEPGNVG